MIGSDPDAIRAGTVLAIPHRGVARIASGVVRVACIASGVDADKVAGTGTAIGTGDSAGRGTGIGVGATAGAGVSTGIGTAVEAD